MVLSETPYFLPVPEYPHSFIFYCNSSYVGRGDLRLFKLMQIKHNFALLPIILPH